MMTRLAALAERRACVIADIQRERNILRSTVAVIRQDMVYAGLGLLAGRLLTHHAWLHTITLAVLAIAAGKGLTKKSNA
jgi:hypothetical protein